MTTHRDREPLVAPEPTSESRPEAGFESWTRALDLQRLTRRFGSPLYLFHPRTLERNFAAYRRLVSDPGHVLYPVKANPSPPVLERLAALGSGADVASRSEINAALAAGIPVERLSYTSPAMDLDQAAWLLRAGGTVVADSADGMAGIARRLRDRSFPGRLALRLNPGSLPGYRTAAEIQKYTDHGSLTSQFGVPSEDAEALLAGCPLPVTGLHLHVGTQMDNVDTFLAALDFLHQMAELLGERTGHPIAHLNLGGGLGIPFLDDQRFPTAEHLVTNLAPRLQPRYSYYVEPGNSLVGDAMALAVRVVATKTTRGKRWAIVDAGTDQLVKHTIAGWEHRIVDTAGRPLARTGPDGLAGPLCFAGDVLLPETRLDGIAAGDPLLIQHAGAYCEAVASRFNGRRAPAQVAIGDDGEARLVRRGEDLFFEPANQTVVPASFATGEAAGDAGGEVAGEVIDKERLAALSSHYMRTAASEDRFRIVEARRLGARAYRFTVEAEAAVDFVAMPFALRVVGDAAIIAVGCELEWTSKPGPVWATRLTMTCGGTLPAPGRFACHIALGALVPGPRPGVAWEGTLYYRLGSGEVSGTARVVVPSA